jgi:hypothetical protein
VRRTAAATALLCAALGAPAARAAAATSGALVVTGSRTSVVEVVLPRATTKPVGSQGYYCADFATKGTFAAYILRPVSGRGPTASGMLLNGWHYGGNPPCFQDTSDFANLRAGRYLLYLVTDGATRLRVTLPGYTRDVVARPTKPYRAAFGYTELGTPVSAVPSTLTKPYTHTRRTWAVQAVYVESALPVGEETAQICTAPKGEPCPDDDIRSAPNTLFWGPDPERPDATGWFAIASFFRPEFADRPGAREAHWLVQGLDATRRKSALWFQLELNEPAYPLGK